MTEVLVYSPSITTRLKYTLDWALGVRSGLNVKITDDEEEFAGCPNPKINYSNRLVPGCLNISSTSILFEEDINKNVGLSGEWNGLKTFFKRENTAIPFDIFGAIFYCISRMEEYGAYESDSHGRYKHTNSVLHRLNVLPTPIVDLWLEEFKKVLLLFYPSLQFKNETYKFINTIDVDQAFCFTGKGILRNAGGICKDIIRFNFKNIKERILVLSGRRPDPFDTFEYIIQKHKEGKLNTIVFLLLADYGKYNKNININNNIFLQRIKLLQQELTIGIHPSYDSCEDIELIRKEINSLFEIQGKTVEHSRQHYLKFILPHTFRYLFKSGIRQEYSLGYADAIGFRAGTAHAFHWFDLGINEQTLLEIHPCCVMDVTLKNYLKLSPQQAKETISSLIHEVKKVNGTFIPVWHNESISDFGEWKGWREVYECMTSPTPPKEGL